jgi:hypothetical protein
MGVKMDCFVVRIHQCWDCNYEWIEQVQYGITSNISGEKTSYCPKCNQRASMGSPHKIITIVGELLECKDRY